MSRLTRPIGGRGGEGGFTLVEVLIATSLLAFSLVVMFGFHAQAVRSNLHARKITDCTYLAQGKMGELLALPWTNAAGLPTDLTAGASATTGDWDPLLHPGSGAWPDPINALWEDPAVEGSKPTYFVTWETVNMDPDNETWIRIRVRCTYLDRGFNVYRGTTISSYRYRDD